MSLRDIESSVTGQDEMLRRNLEIGRKAELEHTDNPVIAERIALDHLREFPDYYDRLVRMEAEASKYWRK